ncbi:MAG: DUF4399 domain-containing protein [Gemmatimonadaceae bacterium]|nr:DUF4399 domain-containing protein [Gemmatimonadaceae bacterium]
MRILSLPAAALAAIVAVSSLHAQAATPAAAPANAPAPIIGILLPANGQRVRSPVTVRFRLANYGVAPAGTNMERTGHFHLLIDSGAGAPGTVIPADSLHVHYGKGQIEVSVPMTPGRHVLRAVLGDYTHKMISMQLVSKPVTITVTR